MKYQRQKNTRRIRRNFRFERKDVFKVNCNSDFNDCIVRYSLTSELITKKWLTLLSSAYLINIASTVLEPNFFSWAQILKLYPNNHII